MAEVAHLSTGEVAELLSVHPSTVKRWFRGRALATRGGHRRIALDTALLVARERGRAPELARFADDSSGAWLALRALRARDAAPARNLLLRWIALGRRRLPGRFMRLAADASPWCDPWVLDEVFAGFLRQVGAGWACGDLGIGDERAASRETAEAAYALLGEAERRLDERDQRVDEPDRGLGGSDRAPPVAVVATVEPSQHVLGSLLVRLVLARRGWRVEHLGSGVPAAEIVAVQRACRAELVCVSFTPPQGPADVRRFVRVAGDLAASGPEPATSFALVLGGAGASGSVGELGADAAGAFAELQVLSTLASLDGWVAVRGDNRRAAAPASVGAWREPRAAEPRGRP